MSTDTDLFDSLKKQLTMIDPVAFAETYLTLEGSPFRLTKNGFKPFVDIYRYIGIKALEKDSKPIILVKGRQVGSTIMACVLEMYFMGSGLFGTNGKPPIRIIHAFPFLELAAAYSKTKLSQMISNSKREDNSVDKKGAAKVKSFMQNKLDTTNPTNDSLTFKQFEGGNHIWVESTGVDADRLMGRSADLIFFDECFPRNQKIATINGKMSIGELYDNFILNKPLPLIKTFNEENQYFEYKKITFAWKKEKKQLIQICFGAKKIRCTENQEFLTDNGWQKAKELTIGTLVKSSIDQEKYIRSINDDQKQIILGSFLGDGHISSYNNSRFRFNVTHGLKQKQYCEWKANMFGVKTRVIENNGYAQTKAIVFTSKMFGMNKQFPSQKQTCPQWILDEIDERGIAIWYMDDGTINNKWNGVCSSCISTCSFDEDSHKRFVKKFNSLGIDCHYKKYKGYYSLYFNKDGCKKLHNLVKNYIHENMLYKLGNVDNIIAYKWNNNFNNYAWNVVDSITYIDKKQIVYDIEVEDNHNFILASNNKNKNLDGPIVHNCQRIPSLAIGSALKILTSAKYGMPGKGVQVYFGTPRKKGTDYHKMWLNSSQQYYYLGCERCDKHFPLYTPESDSWKAIWIYGFIVKCPHCGFEQDKREAAERGKWVALREHDDCKFIGFHINQLYFPIFKREDLDNEAPGVHPINTERIYQTEVLGEFYQGDSSPITPEEIAETCADRDRKFAGRISPGDKPIIVLGIDYGQRADLEQLAESEKSKTAGQSYSTAVVLSAKDAGVLSIEYCMKFKRNDPESKKGIIEQLMRNYSIQLAVGDIGFSQDLSSTLHNIYGDKYLVSRAHAKVNNYIKFRADMFPKEIIFERDYYIRELYELMKSGNIRFPFKDYEKCAWLIDHCCSMEIKPSISKNGADPVVHYVKGGTPNDGLMALLNAYLAYKFIVSNAFTTNNPFSQQDNIEAKHKPLILTGYIPRRM